MAKVYRVREMLCIQCMGQVNKFCVDEIVYFEHMQRKLLLHTQTGKFIFPYISILSVKEILEEESFIQCHQSYLVNCAYIHRVRRGDNIIEIGDQKWRVSIGRRYKKGVLQKLLYLP